MSFHILEEWRIRDIEQKAERATSRLYEIDTLNSHVADLERTVGALRSECDGLRDGFQRQADQIDALILRIQDLELGDES